MSAVRIVDRIVELANRRAIVLNLLLIREYHRIDCYWTEILSSEQPQEQHFVWQELSWKVADTRSTYASPHQNSPNSSKMLNQQDPDFFFLEVSTNCTLYKIKETFAVNFHVCFRSEG